MIKALSIFFSLLRNLQKKIQMLKTAFIRLRTLHALTVYVIVNYGKMHLLLLVILLRREVANGVKIGIKIILRVFIRICD